MSLVLYFENYLWSPMRLHQKCQSRRIYNKSPGSAQNTKTVAVINELQKIPCCAPTTKCQHKLIHLSQVKTMEGCNGHMVDRKVNGKYRRENMCICWQAVIREVSERCINSQLAWPCQIVQVTFRSRAYLSYYCIYYNCDMDLKYVIKIFCLFVSNVQEV